MNQISTAVIWISGRLIGVTLIKVDKGKTKISISRNGIRLSEESELKSDAVKNLRNEAKKISRVLTEVYASKKKLPVEAEVMEALKAIFQPA